MKRTLITGASGGLGYELAKLYAKDNNDLILVARNEEKLNKVKEEITTTYNVKCDIVVADLTKRCDWEKVYNYTVEKDYFINNLVNNAGFGEFGEFINTSLDQELSMIDLNISALHILTKLFLTDFVKRHRFTPFGIYRIALGVLVLIIGFLKGRGVFYGWALENSLSRDRGGEIR